MGVFKKVIFFILFIIIDFALWIAIGLTILNYEDFYDESKGEYFSLASMTAIEKVAYIGYYIWIILNIILVISITYRLINKYILKK